MKARYGLIVILLVKIILGVGFALRVPLWTAYHHEVDTYNIVQLMIDKGRLPLPEDFPPGEFEIRQGSQPPLYALMAIPLIAPLDMRETYTPVLNPTPFCIGGSELINSYQTDQSYNMPVSGHAAGGYAFRVLNVLYSTLAALFTYIAARIFFPQTPLIALAAAGMIAFEPYHMLLSATIINDNLLLMMAALNLIFVAQVIQGPHLPTPSPQAERGSKKLVEVPSPFTGKGFRDGVISNPNRSYWLSTVMLIISALLAVMTKINGWITLGLSLLFLGVALARMFISYRPTRRHLMVLAGFGGLALVIIVAIAVFNTITIGSPIGRYGDSSDFIRAIKLNPHVIFLAIPLTFDYTLNDYANALRDVGLPHRVFQAYRISAVLLVLSAVWGLFVAIRRRLWQHAVIITVLGAFFSGATALVILRVTGSQIGTQVESIVFAPLRYYAVGFPALMIAVSYGLYHIVPSRLNISRYHLTGLAVVGIYLIASVLAYNANMSGEILSQNRIPATPVPSAMTLHPIMVDYTLDVHSERGQIDIDLVMTALAPQDHNFMGQFDLTVDGDTRFSCQFVPSRGLYPTTRWEPDEFVIEKFTLNNCGTPLDDYTTLEFGWVNENGDYSAIFSDSRSMTLATSQACPVNMGVFGNELQLTQVRIPPTAQRGLGYEPLVNWVVLDQPLQTEKRQFTAEHVDSDAVYSCTGFTDMHLGSTNQQTFGEVRRVIPRGSIIHADACVIFFPPDAPIGEYNLYVSLSDENGSVLPAVDASGEVVPESRLWLGQVNVVDE